MQVRDKCAKNPRSRHPRDSFPEKHVAFYRNSRKPSRIIVANYDGIAQSKCGRSHCARFIRSANQNRVFSASRISSYLSERDVRRIGETAGTAWKKSRGITVDDDSSRGIDKDLYLSSRLLRFPSSLIFNEECARARIQGEPRQRGLRN